MWANFVFSSWCFSVVSLLGLLVIRYIFGINFFVPLFTPMICILVVSAVLLVIEWSKDI